ncbi:hypothetical protein VMCG_06548 [Cytospora schulzeri]|uniref:Uncharacterized protein n=1 Tax=Cytospora schulzeri TaxID=448051 RepID=A0A423WC36_9PEZI|nr:hypothetical protein VMCG_06548 [Valsa malicola]
MAGGPAIADLRVRFVDVRLRGRALGSYDIGRDKGFTVRHGGKQEGAKRETAHLSPGIRCCIPKQITDWLNLAPERDPTELSRMSKWRYTPLMAGPPHGVNP